MRTTIVCVTLFMLTTACVSAAFAQETGSQDQFPPTVKTGTAFGKDILIGNPARTMALKPGTNKYLSVSGAGTWRSAYLMALDHLTAGVPPEKLKAEAERVKPLFIATYGFDEERARALLEGTRDGLGRLLRRYRNASPGAIIAPSDPDYPMVLIYPDEATIQKAIDAMKGQSPFDFVHGKDMDRNAREFTAVRLLGKESEIAVTPDEVTTRKESCASMGLPALSDEAATYMLQEEKAAKVINQYVLDSIKNGAISIPDEATKAATISYTEERLRD